MDINDGGLTIEQTQREVKVTPRAIALTTVVALAIIWIIGGAVGDDVGYGVCGGLSAVTLIAALAGLRSLKKAQPDEEEMVKVGDDFVPKHLYENL